MTQALLLALLASGRISGTIGYAGRPVRQPKLVRTDAACTRELRDPTVTLSKSGKALANVLVRVSTGAPPAAEPPSEPVVIEQRDCVYRPRVVGAVKGQHLVLKNLDGTLHTVRAYVGVDDKKILFNVAQPKGAKDVERDPKDTVGLVRLTCDVHPWMQGYVFFAENPFFAVSDAEGRYTIELPAGTYTLEAWHEKLGTQAVEVRVEEGKTASPEIAFK